MPTNTNYEQTVQEELERAQKSLQEHLLNPTNLSESKIRTILGNYHAAIEPNFIPWMQRAYTTAKSTIAKKNVYQNIVDEINEDHPKMLREFTTSAKAIISPEQYANISEPVLEMWTLLQARNSLVDVTIIATLENTSEVFIPYLAKLGEKVGGKNFIYTDTHGEADIKHAQELYKGVVEEMQYVKEPKQTLATTIKKTTEFLESILQ